MQHVAPLGALEGEDTRPVAFQPHEHALMDSFMSTPELLRRVSEHGYWRSDQFGVDWASFEAQDRCTRLLQSREPATIIKRSYDYSSGQRLPVGDCY